MVRIRGRCDYVIDNQNTEELHRSTLSDHSPDHLKANSIHFPEIITFARSGTEDFHKERHELTQSSKWSQQLRPCQPS